MGGLFSQDTPKPAAQPFTPEDYFSQRFDNLRINSNTDIPHYYGNSSVSSASLPNRDPIKRQYYETSITRGNSSVSSVNLPNRDSVRRQYYETSITGGRTGLAYGYTRRETRQTTSIPPVLVKINPNFFGSWSDSVHNQLFLTVPDDHQEYVHIKSLIKNNTIQIDRIDKVNNMFLKKAFELKKEEKQSIFGNVEERLLFHGTKQANIRQICTYNFNWRLCGRNTGHRYGQGISFSPKATYASHYSDKEMVHKVMIVAKVLIGASWIIWDVSGDSSLVLPPLGYDSTQKGADGSVIVKYEDSEYYPAYVVYYHLRGYKTSYPSPFRGRGRGRNAMVR